MTRIKIAKIPGSLLRWRRYYIDLSSLRECFPEHFNLHLFKSLVSRYLSALAPRNINFLFPPLTLISNPLFWAALEPWGNFIQGNGWKSFLHPFGHICKAGYSLLSLACYSLDAFRWVLSSVSLPLSSFVLNISPFVTWSVQEHRQKKSVFFCVFNG